MQFLQTWNRQRQAIYIGVDLGGYDTAQATWVSNDGYYAAKA